MLKSIFTEVKYGNKKIKRLAVRITKSLFV